MSRFIADRRVIANYNVTKARAPPRPPPAPAARPATLRAGSPPTGAPPPSQAETFTTTAGAAFSNTEKRNADSRRAVLGVANFFIEIEKARPRLAPPCPSPCAGRVPPPVRPAAALPSGRVARLRPPEPRQDRKDGPEYGTFGATLPAHATDVSARHLDSTYSLEFSGRPAGAQRSAGAGGEAAPKTRYVGGRATIGDDEKVYRPVIAVRPPRCRASAAPGPRPAQRRAAVPCGARACAGREVSAPLRACGCPCAGHLEAGVDQEPAAAEAGAREQRAARAVHALPGGVGRRVRGPDVVQAVRELGAA